MNPETTIIIPTYNRPNLIGRAIKSVLNQTYQNFEIVVIDSSPDDSTQKVVESFNEKRIKYSHNKEKTGPAVARNQGIKSSSLDSEYIAFLDDDDEFLPQFLEKTVKVLEEKKDITMATSDLELRSRDGKKIRTASGFADFWEKGIGCGCVVKKTIFTKENFWYDERLEIMEDPDLGLRVLKNHKWKCLPDVLFIYYVYPAKGEATLCSVPHLKSVDLFYDKNYKTFKELGRKALGFFYFRTGKIFLKAGQSKRGRRNILRAFFIYPNLVYLLHYLASLVEMFFPGFSENTGVRVFKQKIFKGKI